MSKHNDHRRQDCRYTAGCTGCENPPTPGGNDAEEWRELLLQHLDEDECRWTPKTVTESGDSRGRLTASCAGPSGTGDCQAQWSIGPGGDRDEWPWLMQEHSMTHATYDQLWHLADINAKRRVVARYGDDVEVLVALLLPYGLPREEEEEV
jgi:hypothetical protein